MKNIIIIISLLCFLANICPVFAGEEKKQITYSEPQKKGQLILQKIEKIEAFFSFKSLKAFFSPQHIKEMGPDFWIPFGLCILLAPLLFTYVFLPFLGGAAFIGAAVAAGKMVIGGLVGLGFMIISAILGKKALELPASERNRIANQTRQEMQNYNAQKSKAEINNNQREIQAAEEYRARIRANEHKEKYGW